ncbi:MAG: hypothetical protein AAGC88_00455 [Bacteroidota bacterium]
MNKLLSIRRNSRRIGVVFGIVTAMFVICSSTLQYHPNNDFREHTSDEITSTDKGDNELPASSEKVSAFTAVTQAAHVHLAVPILLYFGEINEVENQVEVPTWLATNYGSEFLKTLFRRIISPNAP